MSPEKIIRRPIVLTEKASRLRQENKVVFEVAREANKIEIRRAVEKLFGVKVTDVHTLVNRGKERRMGRGYAKMQNWKKAMVTLAEGQNIDFFEEGSASAS
jgi:large subunit ribosomal protein L23